MRDSMIEDGLHARPKYRRHHRRGWAQDGELAAIKKNKPRRGVNLWKQAVAMAEPGTPDQPGVNELLQAGGRSPVTASKIYYRLRTCPEVFE